MSEFERKAKLFLSLIELDDIENVPDAEINEWAEELVSAENTIISLAAESVRLRQWLDYIYAHSRGKAREWASTAATTEEERPNWD